MAAVQDLPTLSEQERRNLRQSCTDDDLKFVERQIEKGLTFRKEKWTTVHDKHQCPSAGKVTVVLIGLGGVGKSTLGNVLTGSNENVGFKTSNSAAAETLSCTLVEGDFEGKRVAVLDTPGYILKDLIKAGASKYKEYKKTIAQIKDSLKLVGDGVNVFILVMNAADPRNRELEVEIMNTTKVLNPKSTDHCMLVVTHSAAAREYKTKGINAFLEDSKKSQVFNDFLTKVNKRVVLVELTCSNTALNDAGMTTCVKEMEQAKSMVMNMVFYLMAENLNSGLLYSRETMEKDIDESCFPSDAMAWTPKGQKAMNKLQINDEVLVVNDRGLTKYERVIMFSHAARDEARCFLSISTKNGKVLRLSPGHLIHVGWVGQLKPAREVRAGDVIFTCSEVKQEPRGLRPVKVSEVSHEWLTTGIFCPHTPSGSIIVDEVLASCYTDFMSPTLAHALMFPVRTLHRVLPEDWFVWLMPYNSEQGMPKVLWSMKNTIPSCNN